MKYLLLIYGPDFDADAPPDPELMDAYWALEAEVEQKGIKVASEALQPVSTAVSVRVRDGKAMTTDGPFAETKEKLGGFYLLDCKDLDEAIEYAVKIPDSKNGTIEVRPVMTFEPPA